jgi:hypothetical protein
MQLITREQPNPAATPVIALTNPETPIYKVISPPLNTINRRKRKTNRQSEQNKQTQPFPDRQLRQNAHFAQPPATAAHIVHAATAKYAQIYHIKGKLTTSALGAPSQDHTFTDDSVFKHIYLHLILSDFLLPNEIKALNTCHACLNHF